MAKNAGVKGKRERRATPPVTGAKDEVRVELPEGKRFWDMCSPDQKAAITKALADLLVADLISYPPPKEDVTQPEENGDKKRS
ncbi:hypothetical protein [Polyangium mundeleinium]|uniref:Uncharacterized protein n=1 Tax=Polyangium mundeleinium TaxID=2995306 RepID=A0ABT5EGN8_9BACT|nr:hypothetical protein [Polyangium mundeleinium]MDC0740931.1 hypothetical protein [Polyangium mundeleinium]